MLLLKVCKHFSKLSFLAVLEVGPLSTNLELRSMFPLKMLMLVTIYTQSLPFLSVLLIGKIFGVPRCLLTGLANRKR